MTAILGAILAMLVSGNAAARPAAPARPDTVEVASGGLRLHGLVWRPEGPGSFPAVFFSHGNSATPRDPLRVNRLGPVFARHGYVFFCLFRRGDGLSVGRGEFMWDALERERAAHGEEARDRLYTRLFTVDHLDDVRAGVASLRSMSKVDSSRIAIMGHSFGGSLALLMAETEPSLRAVVAFGTAAMSWSQSGSLRDRLLAAVRGIDTPVLHVYAANDYSTEAGRAMVAESERSGGRGTLLILPAIGRSPRDGHAAVYDAIPKWQRDVFGFLDRAMGRKEASPGARKP